MKKAKSVFSLSLALLLALLLLCACGTNVEKEIVGSWRDSTDSLGYDFAQDGTVKIHYLDFTIPVINTNLSSDLQGTYSVEKDESGVYHLKLSYTLLASIKEEYLITIKGDTLTMTHATTGNTYTLIRGQQPVTTTAAESAAQ